MSNRPEILIHDTVFLVDIDCFGLIEQTNEKNVLYASRMKDLLTHYEFHYDPRYRTIDTSGCSNESYRVSIRQFKDLDPEGMARRIGRDVSFLNGKSDTELILDQDDLRLRLAGKHPVIDLYGHTYYVNGAFKLLEPKNPEFDAIKYDDITGGHKEDGRYWIVYHPATRTIDRPQLADGLTSVSKGAIVLSLPHPDSLDPVAYCRRTAHFGSIVDVLKSCPMKMDHKAELVPEEKWRQRIKENVARQKVNVKNTPAKRKGRRI